MTNLNSIETSAQANWGAFRKWLSAHPLTGWWLGVVVGAAIGYVAFHVMKF